MTTVTMSCEGTAQAGQVQRMPGSTPADRAIFVTVALLLAMAIVLGGGGSPSPGNETLLIGFALLAAAVLVTLRPPNAAIIRSDLWLWAVLATIVAVPLVQLVPLPPSIWRALPGRAPVVHILDLAGKGQDWRPTTLFPAVTLASLLCLIVPLVTLYGILHMDARARLRMLFVISALAVLSAVLGLLQFIDGDGDRLKLYAQSTPRFATGFFANRNALPDLLVTGAIAMLAVIRVSPDMIGGWPARIGAAVVLLVLVAATLATGSRTGILLLAVAGMGAATTLGRVLSPVGRGRRIVILALAAAILVAGVFAALRTGTLSQSGDRFDHIERGRSTIWRTTSLLIPHYWPAGVGVGNFMPVYQMAQPLDEVEATIVNRAHNDYLEVALESGVIGMAALLLLVGFVIVRVVHRMRTGGVGSAEAWFSANALLVIALHSIVDYPLRNLALLTVAGVALGMLAPVNARYVSVKSASARCASRPGKGGRF